MVRVRRERDGGICFHHWTSFLVDTENGYMPNQVKEEARDQMIG